MDDKFLSAVSFLSPFRRRRSRNSGGCAGVIDEPDEISRHLDSRDYGIYETRQPCIFCSQQQTHQENFANISHCDYAYTWDSPNRKTRKAKAEKIYSQGIYGPLPCKCVPIVLKELREGDKTSALGTLSVADERVSRDSAPLKYTFDLDPDVVRNSHTERSAAGDMNPYGPPTEGANNSNPYGTSTFAVHNTQRVDSETDQYTL